MVIVRWLTQSVSLTQYVWHWETPSCVSGPVLLIFLWMNLSLGKCGCDSFLNLFRREVFMVPVRILGNLVRVSSVFVMSDWILPYSSDVNVQTLFIKPHSRKEKKRTNAAFLHFSHIPVWLQRVCFTCDEEDSGCFGARWRERKIAEILLQEAALN